MPLQFAQELLILFALGWREAIVVGSAVVNQIATNGKSLELVDKLGSYVKAMADAVKSI